MYIIVLMDIGCNNLLPVENLITWSVYCFRGVFKGIHDVAKKGEMRKTLKKISI